MWYQTVHHLLLWEPAASTKTLTLNPVATRALWDGPAAIYTICSFISSVAFNLIFSALLPDSVWVVFKWGRLLMLSPGGIEFDLLTIGWSKWCLSSHTGIKSIKIIDASQLVLFLTHLKNKYIYILFSYSVQRQLVLHPGRFHSRLKNYLNTHFLTSKSVNEWI